MEEWVIVEKIFPSEDKAQKAALVIKVTESRLLSATRGAQYDIETEVAVVSGGWQIRWRKVLMGYDSGCSNCGSCQNQGKQAKTERRPGKVLQFKSREK